MFVLYCSCSASLASSLLNAVVVICPAGRAIGDLATSSNTAHALAECSNRGKCNRATGQCECFSPFEGAACNEMTCPSNIQGMQCSGHGVCYNMAQIAELDTFYSPVVYGSNATARATIAWDYNIMKGCVCNSSWEVGLGADQYQLGEYFKPDCSQSMCCVDV